MVGSSSKRVLVIPSIREDCLVEFMRRWQGRGGWDTVVLVEDNPEKSFRVPGIDYHYSWKEIEATLGAAHWIISRRDSAIRAFGFYVAWWLGADYVLTLDDDCYPSDESCTALPLFQAHLRSMLNHSVWTKSLPGRRTRGLPYRNLGVLDNVRMNVGLWTGAGDPDAIEALTRVGAGETDTFPDPPPGSWIVPVGQLIPVCSMNICVSREAIPLCYYPPMGKGQRYARFDDIWMGIIAKYACDSLRWGIAVGEPWVRHSRASDPFVNLTKEAPGIALNETLWEEIMAFHYYAIDPLVWMAELGKTLEAAKAGHDIDYTRALGRALQVWAKLFAGAPKSLAT